MGLDERRPGGLALSITSGFDAVVFQNVADGLIGNLVADIGQRALNAVVTPGRILAKDLSLIFLAPSLSKTLRDELQCLTCETSEAVPGIHRVTGLPFTTWIVETDVMADHVLGGTRATRKPRMLLQFDGEFALRVAARQSLASSRQLPPRDARYVAVSGPGGSSAGKP